MVGEIASKQNDDSSALIIIIILSFDINLRSFHINMIKGALHSIVKG